MNDTGSTLTEYALIAALVSIALVAISGNLRFPGAPVVALSAVASGPRELGSPGLDSEFQAHPQGGRSLAGVASGPGSLRGAGASGSAQGTWVWPTVKAPPQARNPEPSGPTIFGMAATGAQLDEPSEGARSAEPDEETAGPRGRQAGDRSRGGGKAAGIRLVSHRTPGHRPDPAVEQLVSLGPDSEAEALTVARTSFGEIAGTARGDFTRELQLRATSGFSRQHSARPAEAPAPAVTGTFRIADRQLWALLVLMLVGLGFGAQRLARRLRSRERRARNS